MSQSQLIRFLSHASRMREEGQTMAEYGVVLTVITIGIVTALAVLATQNESALVRVVRIIQLIT
jgi:Flp pilus assembly pilin Flp